MRRPATFGLCFLGAIFLTVSPRAQSSSLQDIRYEVLAADEKELIDRIAADFYQRDLRQSQNQAIEDHTSARYLRRTEDDRAAFRDERRAQWREMTAAQRGDLQDAKRPNYGNLTEEQKAPFRRHAINLLGGAGAIDENALADALRSDI